MVGDVDLPVLSQYFPLQSERQLANKPVLLRVEVVLDFPAKADIALQQADHLALMVSEEGLETVNLAGFFLHGE